MNDSFLFRSLEEFRFFSLAYRSNNIQSHDQPDTDDFNPSNDMIENLVQSAKLVQNKDRLRQRRAARGAPRQSRSSKSNEKLS